MLEEVKIDNRTVKKAQEEEFKPSILAFTPRQVLLLLSKQQPSSMDKLSLKPEKRTLLLHSIAQFLKQSGFSKTLQKFLSEAVIKKDELTGLSHDLEEIFCKFLDNLSGDNVYENSKSQKAEELRTDVIAKGDKEGDFASNVGDGKKKKKTDKSGGGEEKIQVEDVVALDVKAKEKKKSKKKQSSLDTEAVVDNDGAPEESVPEANEEKSKDKKKEKKKKNKPSSDPILDDEKLNKIDSEKSAFKTLEKDVTEKKDKSSKKRKRVASEEDGLEPAGEKPVEVSENVKTDESKRQKTELNSSPKTEEKPFTKELNEQPNWSLKENGEKSSMKKTKKYENGSAEPKSVEHFQRIKVDEVVFSNEKLKDNSYWAKDGAETGYGAKAQEILGQVRGRVGLK
ncbi:suppressor protein SRP40 isoform X2 [Mercurialis annua]|uniref:suppressor protein SRP40 isoform X2 n=1 Tax=Mercurialis annua TaxID=3986 RepID=UPI002160A98D|nr:suppressor protein SRP40 isoform X2 [Mercurialis annua]